MYPADRQCVPWNSRRTSFGLASLVVLVAVRAEAAAADSAPNLFRVFSRTASTKVDTTPHPAVVRVLVDEGRAMANGSGSFVAARDPYGLVVTNWHVVRDATGKIEVVFPDGFRSAATVLKTDEDWDLAALLIWRPKVHPLQISNNAPQPGDALSIAGFGQGDYRSVWGKCTQYVAPSVKHPYEMVELSAQARQGDSGGPILNERGELAGVLFGANRGTTSGSFCGRVRLFLTSIWPDLDSPAIAPSVDTPLVGFTPVEPNQHESQGPETNLVPVEEEPEPAQDAESGVSAPVDPAPDNVSVAHTPPPTLSPRAGGSPNWDQIIGVTRWDQAKTVLALIGLLAIWGQVSRWLSS